MTKVLVTVDGAASKVRADEVVELQLEGSAPNVRLQVDAAGAKLLAEPPPVLIDFLRLATAIYSADTRVKRGTEYDVFNNRWPRDFHFVVPVSEVEVWRSAKNKLVETIMFLTGDVVDFSFVKRVPRQRQSLFNFKAGLASTKEPSCVVSFSGGADSLAATLRVLAEGGKPLLVSHRSNPKTDSRQTQLVAAIRAAFSGWSFPHVSTWASRAGGRRAVEFSQRSRSLLFAANAAATAAAANVREVLLSDNGVVSINLPQSAQNWGTLLSRSTHPRYIEHLNELLHVLAPELSVRNSLLFDSKSDVLRLIESSGHPELLQESISCAHVEQQTNFQPHCGTCTQCVDRRFAVAATKLEQFDLPERYAKNIFIDALDAGEARTHAENYVRFALKLEQCDTPERLFDEFRELDDIVPFEGDAAVFAERVFNLFRRHQTDVNRVLEEKIAEYSGRILRGQIAGESLLGMVSGRGHLRKATEAASRRLSELLSRAIPPAFQTVKVRDERHFQDVAQGLFTAAQIQLHREAPQVAFASVTTKPDFSDPDSSHAKPVFVEFKLVKARKGLNRAITEITSRITVYRQQGADALFVVYDPTAAIADTRQFVDDLEAHSRIYVAIVR